MPAADVYRSLWRHRWFITTLTLLAAVAAYVFSSAQPNVYETSGLIRIQQRITSPNDAFGSLELGKRLAQTYAHIVNTNAIRQQVRTALPDLDYSEIYVYAEPVGDVELLRVTARSESPATAARVANATTAALRDFVGTTGELRDQIVVIDRAGVPDTPISPRPLSTTMLMIVLALLFNGALALLRDFLSDRLPSIEEIEEKFGKPVLATVPPLSLKHRQKVSSVVSPAPGGARPRLANAKVGASPRAESTALQDPPELADRRGKDNGVATRRGLVDLADASSEPFRSLRLSIDLRPDASVSNVIVFTSAETGEGKSTLAANYALMSAVNERRVLLVDADIRSPTQHEIFAVRRVPGLTDVLGVKRPATDVVHSIPGLGRLDVLTAGTQVPRAGDLTGSRFMREALETFSSSYDLVVVDTPPMLATSDGANIAASVGAGLVFVVDRRQRTRPVSRALKKLELVGVNVLGLVLNREGRLSDYGYTA